MTINSDFKDYYDETAKNIQSNLVYNRFISKSMSRGKALKYLSNMGIKTIEMKQASEFSVYDKYIVIYNDVYAHNGKGKLILSVEEALKYHSNCLASQFYETDGLTVKYTQIGKRRFYITYKKDNILSLDIGNIIDVKELEPAYNEYIRLPIFSIDYISIDNNMVATDFNECQNMGLVYMDRIIDSESVVNEIINAIKYYKIG